MKNPPKLKWNPQASVADNASRKLPALARAYFEQAQETISARSLPENLHQLRLATKRFRYTLELFRPLYGPGLEKKIETLRGVQQQLGDLNDCAATRRLLLEATMAGTPVVKRLLNLLDKRVEQGIVELRQFWAASFDHPGAALDWSRYLAQYAGRGGKTRRPARKASSIPRP